MKSFFSEEKMTKTEINGILYTVEKLYKVDVGNCEISHLLFQNNSDAAIKKFREMLPEYRNSEEN